MLYGYLVDGRPFAPVTMCSRFNDVGAWHTLTDKERAAYGWYPCVLVGETFDSRSQLQTGPVLTFDQEAAQITATYTVTDKTFDAVRMESIDGLAAYRLRIEEGGASVPGGGTVPTTRADQSQLNSVYNTLKTGLVTMIDWKSPGGWVSATLEQVEPVARISAVHVQSCFSAERHTAELIDAAKSTRDLLAIDVTVTFDAKLGELLAAAYPLDTDASA